MSTDDGSKPSLPSRSEFQSLGKRIRPARRASIRAAALRYIADHMRAVLNIDPGPHEIAMNDAEDQLIVQIFEHEADKIEDRADKIAARPPRSTTSKRKP